jgi:drug/metabolite transporter (DMT)-like permease
VEEVATDRASVERGFPTAPVVVAVLVMVVWGATPILTRVALDDMEPLVVATSRTILAGLLAAPLLVRLGQPLPRARTPRRLLAVSAAAGFVVFPLVYTVGQERTSGLHGVMILAALPIFTGLYAAAVARRRPSRGWLVGCVIALAGEVLLIGARGGGAGDATLLGDLLVLAAALVVSAGYVAGALLPPRGVSSVAATFWGVVLGAIVLSPLAAVLFARDGLPEAGWKAWGAVAVLAIATSVVGYIGWYWALDRGGIARISTVQFLQPLSGFALAVVVLGDSVTPVIAVGAAAILCGIVIAQRA